MRRLAGLALAAVALILAAATVVRAETATIDIRFLDLQEAADLARSELSPAGRVMTLASRRILVVDDDAVHVAAVRDLIRRLDVPAQPLTVRLHMAYADQASALRLAAQGVAMPGGWVRLEMDAGAIDTRGASDTMLRILSGRSGSIEAGTIVPVADTRPWLAAHGMGGSVTLVPVTAGFDIEARLAGDRLVHIRLHPWLRRLQGQAGPGGPPVIGIADADTELDVPLGQWVTIGAVYSSAEALGRALLSGSRGGGTGDLVMRIRVDADASGGP